MKEVEKMGYPTDLTDIQWEFIEPIFRRVVGNYGNRAKWSKRILMNAVLYINRTGVQWEMLPNDFPPYTTVSSFYHRAIINGVWELINKELVELDRVSTGRDPEPTFGLIDSQSVKTIGASEERGIDGGKKNKGTQTAYSD
jgi:putative transposase